jgi:predicted HicB family RNase H-like nuclease
MATTTTAQDPIADPGADFAAFREALAARPTRGRHTQTVTARIHPVVHAALVARCNRTGETHSGYIERILAEDLLREPANPPPPRPR